MKDDNSFKENPQMDQHDLPGVLIRTVTDLQVMKEKYEGGLTVYNKILDAMEISEEVELARQMMSTGLEVHVSLLSFVKDACQLVGVGSEWIEVKEEPDIELFLKVETEDSDMIQVKTEVPDSKPQNLNPMNFNIQKLDHLKTYSCDKFDDSNEDKKSKHGNQHLVGSLTVPEEIVLKMNRSISEKSELSNENENAFYKSESTSDDSHRLVSAENEPEMDPDCQEATGVIEMSMMEKKKFPCRLCEKSYDDKGHLKLHIIGAHTKERPFVCDVCNKAFKLQGGLKAHVNQVHVCQNLKGVDRSEENPYKCDKCQKSFRTKVPLINHQRCHCNHCDQHFESLAEKKQHIKAEHSLPIKKGKFICSTCGHTTESKEAFNRHLKIHEDKEYSCQYCNKLFTLKQTMKEHVRIHTGEKPFVCQLCGMRFRKSSGLSQHKIIHTGERPFVCIICGKGFTQGGNLKTHMKSHAAGTIPPVVKVGSP